jgi:hypothetical protein
MTWPVPLGVRVRANFKTMFFAQLADCRAESAEISNFPEYEHRLNAAQKLQLRAGKAELIDMLRTLPDASIAAKIEANTEAIGMGIQKLKFEWPLNPAQMEQTHAFA